MSSNRTLVSARRGRLLTTGRGHLVLLAPLAALFLLWGDTGSAQEAPSSDPQTWISRIRRDPSSAFFVIKPLQPDKDSYRATIRVLETSYQGGTSLVAVEPAQYGPGGQLKIPNGDGSLWIFNAKYEFSVNGRTDSVYAFVPDKNASMMFAFISNLGFVYLDGKGTVVLPSGRSVYLMPGFDDAEELIERGNAYVDMADYDRALQAFNRAEKLTPGDSRPVTNRGMVYLHLGEFDRAIEELKAARKRNSKNYVPCVGLAVAYEAKGQYEKAIAALDEAIELAPTEPGPWYNKGLVCVKANRAEDAIVCFQRFLQLERADTARIKEAQRRIQALEEARAGRN